ncbi:MAG TPA: WYL domain-containing protein [Polyangiaceae bacterium]|nr:WYL domain-containing protein [Polyangiaceae bacterium]
MGRRGALETVTAVLVAFLEERTWEQAALARRVGVTTRTLRSCLLGLAESGVPLEADAENGSRVFWSVPAKWLPGAASLTEDEVSLCARILARTPRTTGRDRLLGRLLPGAGASSARNDLDARARESVLSAIEDALRDAAAVRASYRSTAHGVARERTISIQRIAYGEPVRVVGHCHRTNELRWFRVDRFESVSRATSEPFVRVDATLVHGFIRESLDGFHGSASAAEVSFVLKDPSARWAIANLPPMDAVVSSVPDEGWRVVVRTSGLDVLARWLVGLGAAARVETPELRDRVARLAEDALAVNGGPRLAKARARPRDAEGQRRVAPKG